MVDWLVETATGLAGGDCATGLAGGDCTGGLAGGDCTGGDCATGLASGHCIGGDCATGLAGGEFIELSFGLTGDCTSGLVELFSDDCNPVTVTCNFAVDLIGLKSGETSSDLIKEHQRSTFN